VALVVVLFVTLLVFAMNHLLPGNPARALLGPRATPQSVAQLDRSLGYGKPIPVQYWDYLVRLAHGDLGFSYHYNLPVTALIGEYLPKTLLLVGLSFAVGLIIAIPVGLLQGLRVSSWFDKVVTGISFLLYAMPSFWLALLLVEALAIRYQILPFEAPQGATVGAILAQPGGLILPVMTLGLGIASAFVRYMRSSTLDALVQDYVLACRAKGMSETRLVFRHLLRNSMLPIVTLVGASIPYALSGIVIIEAVFNFPGMGLLFWSAATVRDFSVLIGCTLIIAIGAVAGSLLADLLYMLLDPRIRSA
jgi:peptide/nickel transport system permease protein